MRFKVLFYRFLFAMAGFLLPIAVLAGAAPYVINAEPFKRHLIKELREWTGSHVELSGPVAIESFGSLSLNARDVKLYAFKGFPQLKTLKAEEIVARIAWIDLFVGRLNFDKIKISGAQIQMNVFGREDSLAAAEALLTLSRDAQFDAFVLQDSTISIGESPNSEKNLLSYRITSLFVTLDPSSQDIEFGASLFQDQERISAQAKIRAGALREPGAVLPLELALESPHTTARFEGTAKIDRDWRAVGKMAVALQDPSRLGKWLDQPYWDNLRLPVSLSGNADITKQRVVFDGAVLSVAGQNGTGEFDLNLGGNNPQLLGSIAFAAFDLAALTHFDQTGTDAAVDADFLKGVLENIRLDLRLSAESLTYEDIQTGETAITLLCENGQFSTEIAQMAVLGGNVFGHASVDLSGDETLLETRLTGENLDINRMQSFAGISPLVSGNVDGNIDASMTGSGIAEMLSSAALSGKASISDGGQVRFDLSRLASMPKGAEQQGWNEVDGAWSEFEALRFAFGLEDGLFSLKQIALVRPEGNIKANGVIDIRERQLDLQISFEPPASFGATSATQSGNTETLSIQGPLAAPILRSVSGSNRAATGLRSMYGIGEDAGRL